LGQISGVSEITSVSTLGGAAITIQFNLDRNVDGAARDVQAAIVVIMIGRKRSKQAW